MAAFYWRNPAGMVQAIKQAAAKATYFPVWAQWYTGKATAVGREVLSRAIEILT